MKKQTPTYDVFLSHSLQDKGLATFVRESFISQGLSIFELSEVTPGTTISKAVREGLVDSLAVVLLITPSSELTGNLAFEAGMAMAWSKTVFVLYDGRKLSDIPDFLRQFKIYRVDQVRDVGSLILRSKESLTPEQKSVLCRLYTESGVSVDQLLVEPSTLLDMAERFHMESKQLLSPSRLAHELIRMRKAGLLPKLRPVVQSN